MMDLEVVKVISPWLLAGFSAGGSIVAIAVRGMFASKKEVDELRRDHAALKIQVEKLPGHDDFYELKLAIEAMRGDLKAMTAALKPLQHINNLRLEHDLKEKDKA
ncbi:DUF2730 family protein [Vibrio scophthalmi]|nr:DUF2730 family protein [Vibrio scophthalmi]